MELILYMYFSRNNIYLRLNSFSGSVTNISVKEVGQNWALGTDLVIGNSVVQMNNLGFTSSTQT